MTSKTSKAKTAKSRPATVREAEGRVEVDVEAGPGLGTTIPRDMSRLDALQAVAGEYGDRALQNYSAIRNVAEALRDGLGEYLCTERPCVFLVPPKGGFRAENYGSGAFSVAGRGFLPLEPLSFGLGVRVSEHKDYLRIVMTCRREGKTFTLTPDTGKPWRITLPLEDYEIEEVVEGLYAYLVEWFRSRVDRYDNGSYGNNDIGFDIVRAETPVGDSGENTAGSADFG